MRNLYLNHIPNTTDQLKLFCLPYAGAGAAIYEPHRIILKNKIDILPIQLPGRENRIKEQALIQIEDIAYQIYLSIRPYTNNKFSLFGHCLGGFILYEVALILCNNDIKPNQVIISNCPAPHLNIHQKTNYAKLSEKCFITAIEKFGTIPQAVLQNHALIELFVPTLKIDFSIYENYSPSFHTKKLDCPIIGINSTEDSTITATMLEAWSDYTISQFSLITIKGGHFAPYEDPSSFSTLLEQNLLT